jgi:hypothetical protein
MPECDQLLPPLGLIHERLTRNQRERQLLRTLLKLTLRDAQERARQDGKPDEHPARYERGGQ